MESPRQIINLFLSKKHSPEELKGGLFRAAEAAEKIGMTYMEATFQLGDHAKEEGLSEDESDAIIRRAYAADKRTRERETAAIAEEAPAAQQPATQAMPAIPAMPAQSIAGQPIITGALALEQVLAMGLDAKALELLQNHRIDPEALNIPWPTPDWRSDFLKLLKALFKPEEFIEYKMSNTPDATTEQVAGILARADSIKKTMKSLDGPDGALVSINAVNGPEGENESYRFRYAVVDNPKISLAKQLAYYKALNLPCAALVSTGANSVQAWIKINAQTREEYDERVEYLFKTLADQGFDVESNGPNPSQMVRLPGVLRNGKQQYLIGLEQGAKSFEDWKTWVEFCLDGKPLIELASDNDDAPKKDRLFIDNVLQAGELMLFTAPAKTGKSFALMDLALSLSHGEDWLGQTTHKTDVLFVNFDSSRSALLNRLFAVANSRGLSAAVPEIGVLNLRGLALSPLEMAQYIAKRIKGAKQLEDHDYGVIIIDSISAILHNPKAIRNNIPSEQSLLLLTDTLIALTGSAVVVSANSKEFPEFESHADSVISLLPIDSRPNMFHLRGSFRNFPALPAADCNWRYPRFIF
ncbi:MAG: AAA family ATPase [Hallerella porci]|uniref:AAA domain-containing protein n=1 Tax=Hallerella porci TaxID=1945871 RepID=A0ABX5LNX0_9BACT|nr:MULTISPECIES: AAA family ATPase [Hallerella]MCI5600049.1 helicase RepA family protein [Hallerella sp.]MDY3921086.1 AAA family ATPase [Hallerella porci]PWL04017.1 AAA domain-containing protein [Hallerella porci]